MAFRAIQASMAAYRAHSGDQTDAYFAYPSGPGKYPGVVVIHQFPGRDAWTAEVCRTFAHNGYAAVAPNLYVRLGDGGDPAIVARARAEGGMPDEQVVGDVRASCALSLTAIAASASLASAPADGTPICRPAALRNWTHWSIAGVAMS
jgi:carboxymethylenebutenolidase